MKREFFLLRRSRRTRSGHERAQDLDRVFCLALFGLLQNTNAFFARVARETLNVAVVCRGLLVDRLDELLGSLEGFGLGDVVGGLEYLEWVKGQSANNGQMSDMRLKRFTSSLSAFQSLRALARATAAP